jgi:surfeit locus 1 family protein
MKLRARDWGFVALIIAVAVVTFRLGFWQLSRYSERKTRNEEIVERLDKPPLDLNVVEKPPEELEYRRVRVEGEFDSEHEILLKNRARQGQPGFHLITPLLISQDRAVLVDRGWIPLVDGEKSERGVYQETNHVLIEGIARLSQSEPSWGFLADPVPEVGDSPLETWRLLYIEGIQGQIPYPLLPIYIAQTNNPASEGPIPEPEIDLSEGSHLGYAIQWFSFTAVAVIGGYYWLRRKQDNPPSENR